jgi:hypothetical protein
VTPDQLNRATATALAEIEADAVELIAVGYVRLYRAHARFMANRFRSKAVTASVVPPDGDEVLGVEQLERRVGQLTKRERRTVMTTFQQALATHGISWDIEPALRPEHVAAVGATSTFAAEKVLREAYQQTIEQASREGWSIPRTASAIVETVDGVSGARATALARTDLIGLANGASQAAAVDAFAGRDDVTKIWLATEDERTRETHSEADGQEVPLNEYFTVGDGELLYPGDPNGPDEEIINCRCTIIYGGAQGQAEVPPEGEEEAFSVRPRVYPDAVNEEASMDPLTASTITVTVTEGEPQEIEAAANREPWDGVLAVAGAPTSDGRYLFPGEIEFRELPRPFRYVREEVGGHDNAISIGSIEEIEFIPKSEFDPDLAAEFKIDLDSLPERAEIVYARGTLDGSPDSLEAQRVISNGAGISIDMPTTRHAPVDPDTLQEVEVEGEDPMEVFLRVMSGELLSGMAGKIAAATIVDIPAFEQTQVRLTNAGADAVVASAYPIRVGAPKPPEPLVAAAAPLAPPREWFFMEEPDEPTPLTITADGRVYGHIALWNTCHAGRSNGAFSSCMFAPHSPSRYAQFHLGSILCEDGSEIPIGRLTVGTGHAPLHLGAAGTRKHYDNTGAVAAFVRASDGVFGIWICGAVKSDATDEQIRDLRACPPSGDWRAVDHKLELQAVLAVNVPGYVVPRSQLALAASAETVEVATLILGPPDAEDRAEALRAEFGLGEGAEVLVEVGSDAE